MYNLFTKYLLYTNTYLVCIIYLFPMAFYVLVLKITNSVMLNFLCPITIQTLIIFYIFSICSAHKPHVFQLSSHLPVLGHIYSHTNLAGTTLPYSTCYIKNTIYNYNTIWKYIVAISFINNLVYHSQILLVKMHI